MNQYLDAMVAHDPSHLPVTPTLKFTEDDVVLKLGDGLWGTASARGTYKEYFDDPEEGQVAFFGTMKENGHGIALALRLKIENRRISEAESVVVRSPRTFDLMEKAGAPDPVLLETVPEVGAFIAHPAHRHRQSIFRSRSSRATAKWLRSTPIAIASRTA